MREATINFPCLSVKMGYGDISPEAFHKISTIHPANEIIASFHWDLMERRQQHPAKVVSSLFHPFLEGQLAVDSLQVTFVRVCGKDYSNRISDLVASEMISCKSKSLCFFNCTQIVCNIPLNESWNIDRIIQWDRGIFPSVVLNYFLK
jgi:hypothetical protein